jgi:hypothetical protein
MVGTRQVRQQEKAMRAQRMETYTYIGLGAALLSWGYPQVSPQPNIYFGSVLCAVGLIFLLIPLWEGKKKISLKILLTVAAMAVFSGWDYYSIIRKTLAPDSLGVLTQTLGTIQKNTQHRAEINIIPKRNNQAIPKLYVPGDPLMVNHNYWNVGDDRPTGVLDISQVYIEYGEPSDQKTVDHVWNEFSGWIKIAPNHPLDSLPVNALYFDTNRAPFIILSKKQLDDIHHGVAYIFLAVAISYHDATGNWVQEGCFWAQPPASPMSPWHVCGSHGLRVAGKE